ncbi:helix-turn-helix transcriptional regulator [Proteus cibi]|uniref:Helix-turn-helix transcriptional regulator n=1 Tax=Proteus cibi TaxID=2050966 RepID=A0ABU6EEW8_9GAMM|nr:helix-turn-helix transcriptional regulator [Proteus cibi]EST59680.1 fimbrial operon regulator [Proteus hauseri ZMd44]MEB6857633.1 helix-turn-helix transcriptional regulator [Proteus cibi]MEB7089152.1 helix-turn-helix transcriptional regulator [Proteus cibi]
MMDYDLININVNELVGQRIQKKRKELGYTGAHIADKLGISQQQFSRYERGLNKIDLSYLVTLAVYLRTPIYWFFEDCFHAEEETEDRHTSQCIYFMAESTPDVIF